MNFRQAEETAAQLRQQLAVNQITPAEFFQQIATLRLQDARGVWWQINPAAVGWLRWDGTTWNSAVPTDLPGQPSGSPATLTATPASAVPVSAVQATPVPTGPVQGTTVASGPQKIPQTLFQFLGYYLRSAIKHLPGIFFAALIQGGIVWLLHSIVMIFINDGFGRSGNPLTDSLMALPRELFVAGTTFWVLLGILYGEIKNKTLGKKLSALFHLSQYVKNATGAAGKRGIPGVWLGACLAMGLMAIFNNLLLGIEMAVFAVGSLIDPRDILRFILQLSWSDLQRLFSGKKPRQDLSSAWQNTILSGLSIGFLAAVPMLLIPIPYLRWLVIVFMLGITSLIWFNHKGRPAAGVAGLFLMVLLGSAIAASPVFADDGGWTEAGGTLSGWLSSPGAIPTVIAGIPAALGFIFGSLIGNPTIIPPAVPPTKIYGTGTREDPFRDYPDVNHPPYMDGVYGKGTPDDPYRDYDPGPQEQETSETSTPPVIPVMPLKPQVPIKEPSKQPITDPTKETLDKKGPDEQQEKEKSPAKQPGDTSEKKDMGADGKDSQSEDSGQENEPKEPSDQDKEPPEPVKDREPEKPPRRPVDERRREAHRRELERLNQTAAETHDAANDFWTLGADASDRSHEEVAREGARAWEATKNAADKAAQEVREVVKDVSNDPQIILDTLSGTGSDIAHGSAEAVQTVYDVGKDILTHPIDIGLKTLTGSASDLKDLGVKFAGHIRDLITDPAKLLTFLGDATGINNFIESWDPNKPLGTRLLHVGLGVYKVYMLGSLPARHADLGTTRLIFNEGARTLGTYEASEAFRTFSKIKQANDDFARLTGIDLGKTVNLDNLSEAFQVYQQFSR